MKNPTTFLLCTALLALAACDEMAPSEVAALDPAIDRGFMGVSIAETEVGVMSYNLYVGADLDQVIGALVSPDQGDDFPALLAGIETLQATDYPARAEAIADAVAATRPQVIGLQEVWNIAIDLRPYGVPVTIRTEFLPILQEALARRGLDYVVAGSVINTDASPIPGIRVVDHDVMLVDPARVQVVSASGRNFAANIGPVAPGVTLLRGYVIVNAMIGGQSYTLVNTHLESGAAPQIAGLRALQAQELVQVLGSAPRVILVGDLNDGAGSPMHQVLTGAGLIDAWPALRPGVAGLTCCHAPDLSDRRGEFDQRIDYVFARGFDQPGQSLKGRIDVLGDQAKDRIPTPAGTIWPSDHAGLFGVLRAH